MDWLNSLFGGIKDFGSGLASIFTAPTATMDVNQVGDALNSGNAIFDPLKNTVNFTDPMGNIVNTGYMNTNTGSLYNSAEDAAKSMAPSAMTGLAGIGSTLAGGVGSALGTINKYAPAIQAVGTGYGAWKQGELGEEAMDLKKDAYNFKKDTILKRNAQSAAAYNNGKVI